MLSRAQNTFHHNPFLVTLYHKPLAALTIKDWGRTKQRNIIVYCYVLWSCVSENDSLAMLTDEIYSRK